MAIEMESISGLKSRGAANWPPKSAVACNAEAMPRCSARAARAARSTRTVRVGIVMPLPIPVSTGTSSSMAQCPATAKTSSAAVHAPAAIRINAA
ncbi:hypothetical protein [Streptomyces sp. NPDC094472]|uniref:hypothetical protein n=1 Tax=Streptomyces sp. NPDC094472 TaxID=3155080 RepID=UPI003326499C